MKKINKAASALGKLSAKKRFKGMSKKEISEKMKEVIKKRWEKLSTTLIAKV